jgi:hypothetical protein
MNSVYIYIYTHMLQSTKLNTKFGFMMVDVKKPFTRSSRGRGRVIWKPNESSKAFITF